MSTMNRLANCANPYQGKFRRVLCVCSAGLLRSPTAAFVLSNPPFNFNTRAAGLVPEFALIPVDKVLIEWADELVCMEPSQTHALRQKTDKRVICLGIEDSYPYRSEALLALIADRYSEATKEGVSSEPSSPT